MARTCSSISLMFCETIVTMPVSCGRGDSSENHTVSPFTNISTPNRPRPFAPHSSFTTFFAMSRALRSAVFDMACGCQLSR